MLTRAVEKLTYLTYWAVHLNPAASPLLDQKKTFTQAVLQIIAFSTLLLLCVCVFLFWLALWWWALLPILSLFFIQFDFHSLWYTYIYYTYISTILDYIISISNQNGIFSTESYIWLMCFQVFRMPYSGFSLPLSLFLSFSILICRMDVSDVLFCHYGYFYAISVH